MSRLFDRIPNNAETDEKRGYGRYGCEGLSCNLGQIVDMSATGIRVRCSAKSEAEVGDDKWVSIKSDGGDVGVHAVIRRVSRVNKKEIAVALEFVDISEETRRALYRVGQNIPPISKQGIEGC